MNEIINNKLMNEVKLQEKEIWELASKIWKLSELSLEERDSSALSAKYLEDQGFTISDRGIGGLNYSWVATWGSGKPTIGFTVEFDALPGLGNEIVSKKTPRKDGNHNGHGCGHNLIGSGAICAAVALKNYLAKNSINATIKVFGCPAEEVIVGKNFMAMAGAFDSLDACLHWHPYSKTTVWNTHTVAVNTLSIEFFGKASHAGMSPWNGRSAAHATEIFLHGINVMREQMLPESRIHYLVEKSGEAVNVISDYAKISVTYRGPNAKNVEEYVNWIEEISKGAALITQTTAKFTKIAGCYDLLPNQTMADKMMQYLEAIKAPEWSSEEQKFAKEIQKTDGCEEIGMDTKITPDPKGISVGGATDVGDISYITPTMGLTVSCWPQGLAPHTWAATVCNGMSIGQKGMTLAAEVLALTGLELITNVDFLNTAKKEFLERTQGRKYKSLCPSDGPILDGNHASADDLHDAIHHL